LNFVPARRWFFRDEEPVRDFQLPFIMRQNRVDPFGNFIKTEARGTMWGNRGALHKDGQEILRSFKLEQWITCVLEYKGIRRQIMGPGRLTELFFLDEATSFSAGHRPCALCRRPAYDAFKTAWIKGNPEYGFDAKTSIKEIDHIIHRERISKGGEKITYEENPAHLPDGVMIVYEGDPYLFRQNKIQLWTPFGYEKQIPLPSTKKLLILTPESIVKAFKYGYCPAVSI